MQEGDISLNPGPVNHAKRPSCSVCLKTIQRNQGEASCQACNGLSHLKCIGISFKECKCCKSCSEAEVVVTEQVSESENTAYPKLKSLSELLLSKGLKVCHQTIHSLLPKIDQVRALLESRKGISILGVTESHLSNNVSDTEITIDGYKLYRKDRQSNHRGGGVLVYLADSLSALRREDLEKPELEAIWIELIQPHSKGILLGTLYRPPDGSDFLDAEFMSSFENVLEVADAEKKEVIITGDLNCNFSPGARCQGETKKLKSIRQSMNMTQVVNDPTRVTRESQTLIDIICTSQPQSITSVKVVKSALSDHDMTAFVRKLNSLKFKPRTIKCRNYSKYCPTRFNEDLSSVSWDNLSECQDVDNAWLNFKTCFLHVADKHAPQIEKQVRGRNTPWLANEIKKVMAERDHFYRQARRTNIELHWSRYKSLRNQVTAMIRKEKSS